MSSDDQYFLDVLSSIPNDVKRYSREIVGFSQGVADAVDEHFENVAASLRQAIQKTPWIPDSIKPPPPPRHEVRHALPQGYLDRAQVWVSKNRAVTAAIVAFIGTGTFILWWRHKAHRRKRRARRARNGARTEVVILAGSPHSPLTRSLSLDLDRRGFIIYIPVSTLSDEQLVRSEQRTDIRPLYLDITSPPSSQETLQKLKHHLTTPQSHHPGLNPHTLHLAALILLPVDPTADQPTGSIASLTPSAWSDTLNTHLLYTFTLTSLFLPLLTSQSQNQEPISTSVLLLRPSNLSSLSLPSHGPESVTHFALQAWITTLRSELAQQNSKVRVVELNLGDFDYTTAPGSSSSLSKQHQLTPYDAARAHWAASDPHLSSLSRTDGLSMTVRSTGSPLRLLHNGVFDAVVGRYSNRTQRIHLGRGSWTYDFVGKWVPRGVIGFMLGFGSSGIIRTKNEETAGIRRGSGFGKSDKSASGAGAGVGAGSRVWEGGSEGSEEWEKVVGSLDLDVDVDAQS